MEIGVASITPTIRRDRAVDYLCWGRGERRGEFEGARVSLHDRWYHNSIAYCLDIETFSDSNGDGTGDFVGLTRRLDYLSYIGVNCLWLLPFYPTPNRDDGYDVTDFCAVDPRLGTMANLAEFIREAHERGFRILVDLVANHTSDQHPWFKAARSDPESPYRDYYVWREEEPGDTSDKTVFPGEQDGIWTFDEEAGAYYLHHFHDYQPNLNVANPRVREEFRQIIGLWLQLGVDAFRIDAAPFMIDVTGVDAFEGLERPSDLFREIQEFITVRRGDAMLLGEADLPFEDLNDYFDGGSKFHALFNFAVPRYVFLGLAIEKADPISFAIDELPTPPPTATWFNFLRHHDELSLMRLTVDQRDEIYQAFGASPDMQIYNRGLRRRIAPMLNGDKKRIRLAYSLLFALPGVPVIYYGDEIGMGEDLGLPGRLSVRTPMQWTPFDNGGFSSAAPETCVRPMISSGDYGFEKLNVWSQRADDDSLLNWMVRLIRTRRECLEIGFGSLRKLNTRDEAVLGLRYDGEQDAIIILNNLARRGRTVSLELSEREQATATELCADRSYDSIGDDPSAIRISGYGYRWIRVNRDCEMPRR